MPGFAGAGEIGLTSSIENIDPYSCHVDATIKDALEIIDRGAIGLCLVVDDDGHLVTTITDGDIRRVMLAGVGFEQTIDVLLRDKVHSDHPSPITASVDTDTETLLNSMLENDIRHIPLVDDTNKVVGIALLSQLLNEPSQPMSAVVMAGGFGKRLSPLTHNTPKPMLPVGEKPLLERTIEKLSSAGVREIKISTHYMHEKIRDHFGDGNAFGVELDYVHEDEPLGTAGALGLLARPKHTTLIMNGDILSTLNHRHMLEFHTNHKADFTIAARHYEISVPYGVIEANGETVTSLKEKPKLSFFVNAGIYLAEPCVWDYIDTGRHMDMTDLVDRLIAEGTRVVSFPVHEYWLDIGRLDDYEQAQEDIESGRLR